MANADEIQSALGKLLENRISLCEFAAWFVPYTWNAHLDSDAYTQRMAEEIDSYLIEHDGDSAELREDLRSVYDSFTCANRST